MENKQSIQEELMEIGPTIASIHSGNVYQVPADYFENFAHDVLKRIQTGEEPVYHFTRSNPYSVPVQYFDNLSENIINKINIQKQVIEELEAVAPILNTISKEPLYNVPGDYFDSLKLNNNVNPTVKVVNLSLWKKFSKYAVAAIITGFVAVGIFLFQNNPTDKIQTADKFVIQKANALSEEELSQFLQTTMPVDQVSSKSLKSQTSDKELSNSVKQMSDKEIQQYLSEIGDDVEI